MTAGKAYEYLWADVHLPGLQDTNRTGKPPQPPRCVPACEYIDLLLDLIDGLIDNEKVFPSTDSSPTVAQFPLYFDALMQLLFKRLFRAYAHIYHHHFHQFVALGAEPHLNTCFSDSSFLSCSSDLWSSKRYGRWLHWSNFLCRTKKHKPPWAGGANAAKPTGSMTQ